MFLGLRRATKIADLAEGEERIVDGRVVGRRELTVPGTKLKCVWFYQLSESFEVGARGRGRKMWVPKNAQQKSEGFFVDDGTGQVWIAANEEGTEVSGGVEEAGMLGKKGKSRYIARMIRGGDTVRVRGLVCKAKGAEPGDSLVLRPGKKGKLEILFKKALRD